MTAAAGAAGARSGLQAIKRRWLTPRRLKIATIALVVAAFGVSSVGFSSSTTTPEHPPVHAASSPR
jgi:hypothetical protein